MAVKLKRMYDIVVLKVELLDTHPNVRFTLQAKIEGELADLDSWTSDTDAMGFTPSERGRRGPSYQNITSSLPPGLIASVGGALAELAANRPLWIHLVKPYGVLRFVPWERLLGDALPVPILMLPDFIFPPPRETSSVLDVVLCGSAPLNHEEAWVHQAMHDVARGILDAQPRRTRLHIFADSAVAPGLRTQYGNDGRLDVDVFVYGHEKAAPYLEADPSSRLIDQTGQLRSPWLLWMRDALRGRCVDVVHFACYGHLTRDRGALLFAQSPIERTDRYLAGPVGQTELGTFLTQVGAWSTAFTLLSDDDSESGLRALADDVAQSRPGPLLMHTMRLGPSVEAVAKAYRFLYSVEPMDAPKSSALLMYCQPYRVKKEGAAGPPRLRRMLDHPAARNVQQKSAVERVAYESSPLDVVLEKTDNALPWVASTERFAEQVQLRFQQAARDQTDDQPDESRDLRQQVTLETLDKLRTAVARMAGTTGNDLTDRAGGMSTAGGEL